MLLPCFFTYRLLFEIPTYLSSLLCVRFSVPYSHTLLPLFNRRGFARTSLIASPRVILLLFSEHLLFWLTIHRLCLFYWVPSLWACLLFAVLSCLISLLKRFRFCLLALSSLFWFISVLTSVQLNFSQRLPVQFSWLLGCFFALKLELIPMVPLGPYRFKNSSNVSGFLKHLWPNGNAIRINRTLIAIPASTTIMRIGSVSLMIEFVSVLHESIWLLYVICVSV